MEVRFSTRKRVNFVKFVCERVKTVANDVHNNVTLNQRLYWGLGVKRLYLQLVITSPWSLYKSHIIFLGKQWKFRCHCSFWEMAHHFALFTKGSTLPLIQGFQNRSLVTTFSRQALDMFINKNKLIMPAALSKQLSSGKQTLWLPNFTKSTIQCWKNGQLDWSSNR